MTSPAASRYSCGDCGREMSSQECGTETVNIKGVVYKRLAYPPNYDWMPAAEFPDNCRDCGTPKGGLHHQFCCMEECPVGDGQWLSCAHGPHA
ncbi:hypothetical protein ACQP2Y_21540 [Actinoplanes sp. CA-051413]|uniref:hypothetical protein n=1 Tax=Actinoplanes sp. CA-051413 TaxID=3239899 RepID=UPI003D954651